MITNQYGLKGVRMWTEGVPVDWETIEQLRTMSKIPVLGGPIAVMPDAHCGKGAATVGTVIPTRGAIVPSIVGVDIACGMLAIKTRVTQDQLPDNLGLIRSEIERLIPVGFAAHDGGVNLNLVNHGNDGLRRRLKKMTDRYGRLDMINAMKIRKENVIWNQLGTLGGGNHFIELCLDEAGAVWIMVHSGSRAAGRIIGEKAITDAKEFALANGIPLVDKELAWLPDDTQAFREYVQALEWAQDFAFLNRDVMLGLVVTALEPFFGRDLLMGNAVINCHHNYTQLETHFGQEVWVTRKGAVSARQGEMGIIPGSMGDKSYIVRGRGNADSYCSCSHGAGRKFSRGAAKNAFTVEDVVEQTRGVECRKDAGVIDEIPGAYKAIDDVMRAQADLVEPVATLKQFLCVKG